MITLRKLQSLKEGTRQRKEALLLKELEGRLQLGESVDTTFLKGLCHLASRDLSQDVPFPEDKKHWLFHCNYLRHEILKMLGQEPADWDFSQSPDRSNERNPLPIRIYLDNLRSPFNVGSVFRSAEALGVEELILSPLCASPDHPRAKRSAMGAVDLLPWRIQEKAELEGPLVALETGGLPLGEFDFPEEGTLIIGSEELGVSPVLLDRADQSLGRVTIPMRGRKGSLNVGVATGIVITQWVMSLSL